MRFVLIVLGLIVVIAGIGIATGYIKIWETRGAVVQAPAFNAALPSVSVGTKDTVVKTPTVSVNPPSNAAAPAQ